MTPPDTANRFAGPVEALLQRRPDASYEDPHCVDVQADRHRHQTLVLMGSATEDPARLARIVSALVNNTSLALTQVSVGVTPVYPVDQRGLDDHATEPVELTFRLRSTSLVLDQLIVEHVVAIVSSVARVHSYERSR